MMRFFLYITFFSFFSYQVFAFDKVLNDFKQEIDEAIKEFEEEIKKLPKADSSIAESLDLAGKEFKELLQFTKESLSEENINATLDSIEFLGKNIDAAVKLIPPETLTSMEEIDFTTFEEEEMNLLGAIMTDMNRNKMADFKEMVTTMVVLEKHGFAAEDFMMEMQDLDMGLAMLNDESMNIDFELAGLSGKSLGDVTRELDQFDQNMQKLEAQRLIEKVAGVSESVGTKTASVDTKVSSVSSSVGTSIQESSVSESTKEVTSSVAESGVAEVTVQVAATVDNSGVSEVTEDVTTTVAASNISEVTEDVTTSVAASNISEVTEDVATVVEESNIAETITETTADIEEAVQTAQIQEQLKSATEKLIEVGILNDSGTALTGLSTMTAYDALAEMGILNFDDIQTLNEDVSDFIIDGVIGGGWDNIMTPEAQAQIKCGAGAVGADNYVNLSGTKWTNMNPDGTHGNPEAIEGKVDCSLM